MELGDRTVALPADEIHRLADHPYDLVRAGLTRKQQAELG